MLGKFSFAAVAIPMPAFCGSVYDFSPKSIDGAETPLSAYKGKVLLIVNVASKCGFTPQYKSLETLYEKYKDQQNAPTSTLARFGPRMQTLRCMASERVMSGPRCTTREGAAANHPFSMARLSISI